MASGLGGLRNVKSASQQHVTCQSISGLTRLFVVTEEAMVRPPFASCLQPSEQSDRLRWWWCTLGRGSAPGGVGINQRSQGFVHEVDESEKPGP